MKRLKIGLFIDSFFPNVDGVVMVVDNLAKCLSKYADVTVVAPDTSSKKDDINRPYKVVRIKSIHVPTTEYRLAMPLFSSKKELQDFDIIHIHSSFTIGKLGVKLAKKQNIPVIGTMHTRFDFEFKKYLKFNFLVKLGIKIIIKPYNKCDECIAVNNALVQVFKDYGLTKEAKVMYNATDMDILKQPKKSINKLNAKYNIDEDETVFLFTGRIISIKNVFFILDTLKILKDKGIKFKMFYVGTGPDEEVLKRKIKEYNMTDEVILTGRITDRELLKAFYYRAKLFLFPSLFDASSLVQIEAASQKTPTLFIEGSVTADTVTNNVNGFTALNDVNKYADRIIEILNDNKLYEKVKNGAYNDLAKKWETLAKDTYALYTKAIEDKEG